MVVRAEIQWSSYGSLEKRDPDSLALGPLLCWAIWPDRVFVNVIQSMTKLTNLASIRHRGGRVFILLLLFCCSSYVCGASNDMSSESEFSGELRSVQDPESVAWGFCYRQKDTVQDVLPSIKRARKDVACTQVYYGHDVHRGSGTISQTVHFSVLHESRLSSHAAGSFLQRYGLQDSCMFVGLEDLGDFCLFLDKDYCKDQINVGLPKEHPCQKPCKSAHGYDACFSRYGNFLERKPIVFFSSGRRGFVGAGEFLVQLYSEGLLWLQQNVNFFFTAIPKQEYLDARASIVDAASCIAQEEFGKNKKQLWIDLFDQHVNHVGCQRAHAGHVVFAQDPGNLLAPTWPLVATIAGLKNSVGPWDVLVGWPSHMNDDVSYFAQAYGLFALLGEYLTVGCITGQEKAVDVPTRSGHTLICVKGPAFDFAENFGERMQKKFQYKDVEFVTCDLTCQPQKGKNPLVVGGSLVEEDAAKDFYFDVLFSRTPRYSCHSLQGYEDGLVIAGRMYSKVRDPESCKKGFEYACAREGTAQDILADIAQYAENLSCEKVYCGTSVTEDLLGIVATKQLSMLYERTLSERAVSLFLESHALQDCSLCVSFEDFSDFSGVDKFLENGGVHVGAPRSQLRPEHQFEDVINVCVPDKPIVFCASGRNGFASAGAFLYALCCTEIGVQNPHLHFLFSTMSIQHMRSLDGRSELHRAARRVKPFMCDKEDDNLDRLIACIDTVSIADVYEGKVVFSLDKENILVNLHPHCDRLDRDNKEYDVLVNWLPDCSDHMSLAYRKSACCLFEEMRGCDAGCVTGEEDPDPSKRDRTLLCVNSVLFDGAEAFGRSVARRLLYKAVDFVACDGAIYSSRAALVVGGVVEEPVMPKALTLLR